MLNGWMTDDLLDLSHTRAASLFDGVSYPWEILDLISNWIRRAGETLSSEEFDHPAPDVWIAKDACVASSASVSGPCIIDREAQVRHCAYLRGAVMIGKGCVVGNSTEVKNALLFDGVQVPHYNYVGDSVLGYRAHMGAGVICSNVKSDKSPVTVAYPGGRIETGRKKFGAILGDFAEIGCNSVLCPGSVIGRRSIVYPLSRVRGYLPSDRIWKDALHIVERTKEME